MTTKRTNRTKSRLIFVFPSFSFCWYNTVWNHKKNIGVAFSKSYHRRNPKVVSGCANFLRKRQRDSTKKSLTQQYNLSWPQLYVLQCETVKKRLRKRCYSSKFSLNQTTWNLPRQSYLFERKKIRQSILGLNIDWCKNVILTDLEYLSELSVTDGQFILYKTLKNRLKTWI